LLTLRLCDWRYLGGGQRPEAAIPLLT